ncbi:hypothetical protein [Vibrio apostichopi]|uniref:hypothetical protein n=1 Tax=Vibrio apostichopi TaxID=3035453 RepID=UPI0025727B07|nr:hypothetical protein [Vibrio sp. FE10]
MLKFIMGMLTIVSFHSIAETNWVLSDKFSWNQDGEVLLVKFGENDEPEKMVMIEATRDIHGNFTMFFNYLDFEGDICEYDRKSDNQGHGYNLLPEIHTHFFNGQPVRMRAFCSRGPNDNAAYMYFRPYTDPGMDFVAAEFKKSNIVKIQPSVWNSNEVISVTGSGFTKYWNTNNLKAL